MSVVVCIALVRDDQTPNYWSTSIGRNGGHSYIYPDHWTTKLSYVCQYHSKSLHAWSVCQSISLSLNLSVDQTIQHCLQ